MIRTKEEREQSPESIRMDGLGLKVFPAIGGGEGPNLKLLSLQRNLIKYLENTPSHLSHLVVLDLYDNRIERISLGLLGFTSLRVLLLGKNRFVQQRLCHILSIAVAVVSCSHVHISEVHFIFIVQNTR